MVLNIARNSDLVERRLRDGTMVQAKAHWRGDELHLELEAAGDARVEEKYTPSEDHGSLAVDVQLIVPGAGLYMQIARTYDRTENAEPVPRGRLAGET